MANLISILKSFLYDKKLYQYIGTGAISAAVDLGIFALLSIMLDIHYLIINSISFAFATLVNYMLCANVVFKSSKRFSSNMTIVLTYFVSLVGLGIQSIAVWVGVEYLVLPLITAKILAMGSGFFWNFCSRKYWVFSGHVKVSI